MGRCPRARRTQRTHDPFDLAALGHTDKVLTILNASTANATDRQDKLDHAFWSACHGGQLATAQALARHGATINWLPAWENATPLDIAARSAAYPVIQWLHTQRARTCDQLNDHD